MYRPTVRYNPIFKDYVEELFQGTELDRNQIFRLALFLLGHTKEGRDVLKQFSKDASLPSPKWEQNHQWLWMENTMQQTSEVGASELNEGGTSHVQRESIQGSVREVPRQAGQVHHGEIDTGGIRITVGKSILLPRRG